MALTPCKHPSTHVEYRRKRFIYSVDPDAGVETVEVCDTCGAVVARAEGHHVKANHNDEPFPNTYPFIAQWYKGNTLGKKSPSELCEFA